MLKTSHAGLAELVDALDSGSSVRKDFRVQVPGSASLEELCLPKGYRLSDKPIGTINPLITAILLMDG